MTRQEIWSLLKRTERLFQRCHSLADAAGWDEEDLRNEYVNAAMAVTEAEWLLKDMLKRKD